MAGGNMGDISFSLTLKSRIEEETKKITKELNKIDATGKQAQNALEAISEATKGIGDKGGRGFEKLNNFVKELRRNIAVFSSEDFFSPKKLQQLESVQDGLHKIGSILGEVSKKGAGFNIFPNSVATEANKAKRELYKLSSFIAEINKRHGEGIQIFGVDSTNNIRQSLSELSKYRTELEQIRNNGGIHPITGLTASDVVKSAGFLNAKDEAKAYAKEIKQALKEADAAKKTSIEEEKKNEQIVENILQRRAQERQRVAEKEAEIERQRQEQAKISAQIAQENANSEIKWNEQKAKAFSEALQRQMKASVEAEKKRQVSLFSNGFDTTILEKRIAMLNRMKEIQDKLAYYHPKAQYAFLDYESGLKFGNANTPEMRHKEDELQRLRNIIADLESEFNKLGGNEAFKNVDNQIKNLEQTIARLKESGGSLNLGKMLGLENKSTDEFRIAKEAAMATEAHVKRQNELTAAFEKYFNVQKQVEDAEKRLAEATARTNQARREAIAASRQQAESLVRDRVKELEAQRQQLQGLFGSGKNVLSTQELIQLQQAFSQITQELNTLRSAMNNLGSYSIKDLFSIGRGTSDYTPLTNSMRTVIDQKRESINLERKHQEEITKTAAKVQSDLVRGFERANSHAGKLNSTVQDLKSLFLQGGLVFGAQQFAMSIITTGGEMEKQHIALQSILGDMQNANTMFNQIKELALNSPFTFSELNRDVKQLAAYGVEYDQLYDTTKRLADMSSGLGVSFDRIALAFGQVQARGWLDGKELRQIAYAGIPLLNKLSEFYSKQEGRNVSTSEIKTRISNREVSFDDVKSIFWQMTDAGGQFYNMQQVLSETLLGRYNKLKDAWEIMLAEFASGESLVGKFFKTAIEGATTLVQSLHSLALPAGTILAGYGLKKMLAGGVASNFLSNKASVAADIQKRVLMGQQISQVEQRILVTKNQITGADLRALANARGLTTEKLNQLRLSGKITAEQYNIYRGIVLRQKGEKTVRMQMLRTLATMRSMSLATTFSSVKNVWTAFKTSALAAFRIIGTGAKTLAAEIWSAIGGLPGLIITAVTFGVMHAFSEYQELSQKIKQTQDEIADKNKQIRDFLRDNNVNIAISGGDTKEIDNMIDSYKEKLKELAPYSYKNMLMTADEKKSHADRLKYLEQEIKLLKEANDIANSKLSSRYYYSDLSDTTEEVVDAFKKREDMRIAAMAAGASSGDKTLYLDEKAFGNYIEKLKDELARKFGDIGKDERMREAAMQAMSGIFSSMGVPEDKADIIRTSILQAFGCGDKSAWLQTEVSNSMIALIDKSFPMIGEKIRASVPLNDAEKAKVRELMNDAKNGLIRQYPELERTLQNMLAASNFQAVIKLVIDGGDKLNDLQSELVKRIPGKYSGLMMSDISGQYKTYAERWGKENSWYSARNAANEDITKSYNEYLSAKKSNAKNVKELYTKWQTVKQAAHDLLNYDYEGEGKKSNKPGKKNTHVNKEDKELETLRKRIDLYKKFYSELEKYRKIYGDEGAMIQMRKDKEFKNSVLSWKLSDPGTYGSSIRELMNRLPSSTQKRREYKESQQADIHAKNRSIEEERIRETNNMLSKRLNIISEQYKTYKKIYELTGNSKGASMLAFGYVQSGTYQDYLKEQMKWAVKEHNERTGQSLSADDVLKMNESDFNKHIGSESENASVIYKEWVEETARIKQETIDLLANLVEKNATIDQQIEDENRKYERQLELIKGIKDAGMRDRATEGAEKTHNENLAKLEFERFKQGSDWVTIFDDLDRVSSTTINSMVEKIDEFSKTAGLSVEVVKQLRDALGKLRDEQIDRNPIEGIIGGMQRGNAIGSFINSRFRKGMDISTTTYVGADDAKKMGIQKGNYTKSQLEDEEKGAYDDANKGVSKLAENFKALQDCLSPVINLFEVLGKEDSFLGQATSTASGALGAAAQVSGGLSALGLGNLGPYGAAAGAALSVVTSLFAMHDKALQKEIEASEERQKELDNMTKNVKSIIEDALGGIYSYKERSDTKSTISKITSNYELADAWKKTGIGKSLPFLVKSVYSKETYEAAKEAQSKPGSAYHAELASLKAQKDELQSQRNSENEKKKKDNSKIADYDQQIKEMELQIDSFAKDFLKDIYSIDFKSWASELTDAVVGAWEKGEDAVEAYKEKVKDMVKDVTKNIVTQKIMEAALQKPLDYLTNILKDKGKLDETDMNQLADLLYKAGDEAIPQITGIFEALKKKGLDLRDNGSSSSTKNSIQSITEETADILASYLNAVRLDVSVIREMQGKFIPEMSEIAKSQLTQLNLIAQNTLRNADAAERIDKTVSELNDNFNRVINGTKSLKMK